jgi:hypothetical protein
MSPIFKGGTKKFCLKLLGQKLGLFKHTVLKHGYAGGVEIGINN